MKKNYTKQLVMLILTLSMSALSFAQIIADGTYKILNDVHSEVMSINTVAGDLIVGRAIMAVPNSTDDLQLWSFMHQGGDVYKIQNVGDGSTLGVKDGWCGQFGDVQVGFDASNPYVLIKVSAADAMDTYVFEIAFDASCNFGSTNDPIKCFDIDGGNSGAKIQTFDINTGNPNQQFKIVLPGSLSTDDLNFQSEINSHYHKSSRVFTLSANTNISISNIQIFDLNGRLINTDNVIDNNQANLDFKENANGLYFVKIDLNNNQQVVKRVLVY